VTTIAGVDLIDLERRVKEMYGLVAEQPEATYHFEMGRGLAQRLGYAPAVLDQIPDEARASFAGVGHFFDLARPVPGDRVLDLGSGSGTDVFAAGALVRPGGQVTGIDMTEAQLAKAERLRAAAGFGDIEFVRGHIDDLPFPDAAFTLVVSNGVINLAADKGKVFRAAARVLAPGGRLALADIVSDRPLAEQITCNAELWASCIGGAAQIDDYRSAIEAAGLRIETLRDNPGYRFLSTPARSATDSYGIRRISLTAVKPFPPQ
jgi:arsenite methyltransferase